ncbi:MAG: glycosyltransferase family 2 protein [Actinomycetota bacterium]|nr:glycosyltransferase [Actinomycetota bacterium]
MTDRIPASVLIPTIGRPALLRALLESIRAGDTWPAEVVVVDQSEDGETKAVVANFADLNARVVDAERRGVAHARNVSLRAAGNDWILGVDDDCTVAPDWVRQCWDHLQRDPTAILTGRVPQAGAEGEKIWSRDDPSPRDYTGTLNCAALYPANMAADRRAILELGGFDERLPAAEDNDLTYRWLRAGRRLVYQPDLLVWHHAWRSSEELNRIYVGYGRAQGAFYAKHLRRGDLRMLRFILSDLLHAVGGLVAGAIRGGPLWTYWRRGIIFGLPGGFVEGWRTFRP